MSGGSDESAIWQVAISATDGRLLDPPTALLRHYMLASEHVLQLPEVALRQLRNHGVVPHAVLAVGDTIMHVGIARVLSTDVGIGQWDCRCWVVSPTPNRLEASGLALPSLALYQLMLDNTREGIFLVQDGDFVFANRALHQMLGYPDGELIGHNYLALVSPEDLVAQLQRKADRESGSRALQHFEMRLLHRDGHRVLCEVRADGVEFGGRIASAGNVRDVTLERETQAAVQTAERRFRELFFDSPVGLFRSSALDDSLIEANPELARILGYPDLTSFRRAVTHTSQIYFRPELRPKLVQHALESGGFRDFHMQVRMRNGQPHWVSANVRLVIEAGELKYFDVSLVDIDEDLSNRRELLRSELRYRTLVDSSQVGVLALEEDCFTYVNDAFAAMLGYRPEDMIGREFRDFFAPESIDDAEARQQARRAGEPVPAEYECFWLHRDGHSITTQVFVGQTVMDGTLQVSATVIDVTRQREAERRLRYHATHDPLTGLPNRLLFMRHLAEVIDRAHHCKEFNYAVLFLDLNGFKWVNDSLGHSTGDRLLVEIGHRLEEELANEMLIARHGGDEFTLMPEGVCDEARAHDLAARVLKVFERPFLVNGQEIYSGGSVGLVMGRKEYESPEQLLRDADTAMYRAKGQGRSKMVLFDDTMHRQARRRLRLENDLRRAFEREEFQLFYQPIVDVGSGRIEGAEALVRWRHPSRGLLVPADFLHIAEETGDITRIDAWVLEHAARRMAGWQTLRSGLFVNVNVDERQIASADVAADVAQVLARSGLAPDCLRLEVTESAFRAGTGHISERLVELKALGIGLLVDDFGTGYSSLEAFAASPFDGLKIDQAFVRDIHQNPRHRAIVRTIVAFAVELGLTLTAEGVEESEPWQLLHDMGCRLAQGYLFSKPLDAATFEQLLRAGGSTINWPPGRG